MANKNVSEETIQNWNDILEKMPSEKVDIDENGHYDPEKSPHFHEWMTESDEDKQKMIM